MHKCSNICIYLNLSFNVNISPVISPGSPISTFISPGNILEKLSYGGENGEITCYPCITPKLPQWGEFFINPGESGRIPVIFHNMLVIQNFLISPQ